MACTRRTARLGLPPYSRPYKSRSSMGRDKYSKTLHALNGMGSIDTESGGRSLKCDRHKGS